MLISNLQGNGEVQGEGGGLCCHMGKGTRGGRWAGGAGSECGGGGFTVYLAPSLSTASEANDGMGLDIFDYLCQVLHVGGTVCACEYLLVSR